MTTTTTSSARERPADSRSEGAGADRCRRCLLWLVVAAGILLRVWGVGFRHETWDEWQLIDGANVINSSLCTLLGGHPSPGFAKTQLVTIYGIFPKYFAMLPCGVAALYDSPYLAKVLTRIVASLIPSIAAFYLVHRLCILLGGSKLLCLGALAMLAFAFKHVETAHFAVADSLSAWITAACLLCLVRWTAAPDKMAGLVPSSLLAAVGASTRINVGFCLALTIGATIAARAWLHNERRKALSAAALSAAVFLSAFTLINLPYLVDLREWLETVRGHAADMDNIVRWHFLYYACMTPALGIGGPLAAIAVLGFLASLRKKRLKTMYPLVFFTVIFYAFLSLVNCAIHRWIIPMAPVFAIFGGLLLEELHAALVARLGRRAAGLAVAAVLLAAIAPSAYHAVLFDLNLTERETSYQRVEQFVAAHGPVERWVEEVGYPFPCRSPHKLSNLAGVDELDSGKFDYALCDDFRYPPQRPFPAFLLQLPPEQQRTSRLIEHLRAHWTLLAEYRSRYYTPWADGIARQSIFWIYRAPQAKSRRPTQTAGHGQAGGEPGKE
jgi:hypothetical protein